MKFLLPLVSLAAANLAVAVEFGDDLEFLKQHTQVVVLSDPAGTSEVAVVPAWQGRVMTSTAAGLHGTSYGWVNRELIASGEVRRHFNPLGGEDRFWLGPEGGQFSIFFAKGASFDLDHWFTPAAVDTEPYTITSQSADHVTYRHAVDATNYSGARLQLEVTREVRLLPVADALAQHRLVLPPGVAAVAFESRNSIRNTGKVAWRKETGLLSIWILGMYNASPSATIVVPIKPGPEMTLGPKVNDTYFGKVPADRLIAKDDVVFFRGDGRMRTKIGFPPKRARPLLGSYDSATHTLTLVSYTLPAGATDYVNSMWEIQQKPFGGDVVNSYNDGPPAAGAKQLGNFFELESSSPALALAPGATATHVQQTIHLQGDEAGLDAISRAALGVRLEEIKAAFPK